jgi:anthranilate/para-aminobenzoate synthase component I
MHALPLAAPVSLPELAQRLAERPGLSWLDGDGSERDGRWSFLGTDPVERVTRTLEDRDPLAAFDAMEPSASSDRSDADADAPEPEQVPRWIGYVAYDAHLAGRPSRLVRPRERPVLSFARYDALFAFDHARGRGFVVGDDRAACDRLLARASSAPTRPVRASAGGVVSPPPEAHAGAITRALERIAAGEIYQVNLARCFRCAFTGNPLGLFGELRAASPVPLGLYYHDGQRAVLARTMERFLRWQRAERRLHTRPIKGTIARSGVRDRAEADALRADDKERAEHTMILDLMRNDLGRVAEIGSVAVSEVMAVEAYAGLSHLVSTVACRTRPDVRLHDVLDATFPPGSVTGAPKPRAIEIIEQLESEPRDVYTGALGFVDRAGGLSLAVAIRTAIAEGAELRYFAGGGIVAASDVARELAETELKARVLFDALRSLDGERQLRETLGTAAVLR